MSVQPVFEVFDGQLVATELASGPWAPHAQHGGAPAALIARAFERIRAGFSMPGVIAVAQSMPVGAAIEDLVLVIECGLPEDWSNQVRYLPLR